MEFVLNSDFVFEKFEPDGEKFLESVYTEASVGATVKNVISRAFELMKKLLKWISTKMQQFYRWITGTKEQTKTADAIIHDVGIKPNDDVSDNIGSNENNEIVMKYRETISGPIKTEKIPVHIEPMIASLEKDSIVIEVMNPTPRDNSLNKKKHQDFFLDSRFIAMLIDEIDDIKNKFSRFIKALQNPSGASIQSLKDDLDSVFSKGPDRSKHTRSKYTFTTGAIENLTKNINEMFAELDGISDPKTIDRVNNTNLLNTWINIMSQIQLRINAFTMAYYRNRYYISMKYKNTINDFDTMSKFIKEMIAKGIPAKYIMTNAYIVGTDKINSLDSGMDASLPVSGESRGILFPKDNRFIFKFALSGWGINSNKAEYTMYDRIKNIPVAKYFAKTQSEYDDYAGILCERIHGKTLDDSNRTINIERFKDTINAELKKNNIDIAVEDLHEGNIMIDDHAKELKIIDYGWQN